MNNNFKKSSVTFSKKRSFSLKIKFKKRSAIIYEGSNLIDNKADYCCSQQLSWFSCSYETSKMFDTLIKYPGVHQVFDQFFGAFSLVLNILPGF